MSVTLSRPDGSKQTLTAAWVAGCDGARSSVRELNSIPFPGAPYEHVFFVADVEATGSMVPSEVNVYLWRDGFHLMFPMRGSDHWRIVGILPSELRDTKDVSFDAVMPSVRGELGANLDVKGCAWFSTYRIHHRSASRFRERRCFVLGDAAHIHSPVGAQGMNTGLQDAYNLGWKLAAVVAKQADESLLDTYEGERLPIAQNLLDTTDRGFRFVVADNWIAGLMRTEVLARVAAFAMGRKAVQSLAFRTISQTGINYAGSTLSQSVADRLPHTAPQPGARFPWLKLKLTADGPVEDLYQALDDTHFHLVLVGQPAPSAGLPDLGGLLRVHAIPDEAANNTALEKAGIPQPSFYLIRPDGYVGLCGTRLDVAAVGQYATERLRFAVGPS